MARKSLCQPLCALSSMTILESPHNSVLTILGLVLKSVVLKDPGRCDRVERTFLKSGPGHFTHGAERWTRRAGTTCWKTARSRCGRARGARSGASASLADGVAGAAGSTTAKPGPRVQDAGTDGRVLCAHGPGPCVPATGDGLYARLSLRAREAQSIHD